jgi:hypothetical protein
LIIYEGLFSPKKPIDFPYEKGFILKRVFRELKPQYETAAFLNRKWKQSFSMHMFIRQNTCNFKACFFQKIKIFGKQHVWNYDSKITPWFS